MQQQYVKDRDPPHSNTTSAQKGRYNLTACCKDYVGLGNRSISYYPYSSVGNTFTFDVGSVNVSFTETLARAHLKNTRLPGSPGNETKRVGRRTDVYGPDAPKIPPFRAGESIESREEYKDFTLSWVINRSFTPPYSSVGNTFTYATQWASGVEKR